MSLTKSSVIVSVISLFVSLASLVNQIVIAYYFGAGNYMDIYLFSSSVPLMIGGIISSALSFSLVPHLIKKRDSEGHKFVIYFSAFMKKSLFLIFCLSVTGAFVFYLATPLLYSTLTVDDLKIARIIILISWAGLIPSILFVIVSCNYNSKKSFYFPLILNFFPYVLTVIVTVLFYKYLGIISVSLGVLIGTVIGLLIGLEGLRKEIILSDGADSDMKSSIYGYFKYMRFAIVAMLTFTVFQSIDSLWATKLGPSNLSYLGYSQRILVAFGGLIIAGPSTVLIPRLTKAIQDNRDTDFLSDSMHLIKLVISIASVLAVVVSVSAKPVIRILFQRGEFTYDDVINMSEILPYMLAGMVLMLSVVVLFRALFVKDKGDLVALIGLICTLIYFTLSWILSSLFAIKGIAVGYLITWLVVFLLTVYRVFSANLNFLLCKKSFLFVIKQIIILLAVFVLNIILAEILNINSDIKSVGELILLLIVEGIITALLFILLVVYILKIEEVVSFLKTVISMFRI